MESIGVIRRIDEIGRVVIPKEIRNELKIKPGDCLEVLCDGNSIFMKKKDLIKNSIDTLDKLFKSISSILNIQIIITDTSKFLYSVGKEYNNIVDKSIDEQLYEKIMKRKTITRDNYVFNSKKTNIIIEPIIVNGDTLGSVLLFCKTSIMSEKYETIAKIIVNLLVNHIDI